MRTEYVSAESREAAESLCPWAAGIVEVDNGGDGARRWACYESIDDYRRAVVQSAFSDADADRVLESFRDAYREARDICLDVDDAASHRPHAPVVALDNGRWRIMSALHVDADTALHCPLDTFDDFWHETYRDADYTPTAVDMGFFAAVAFSESLLDSRD